MSISGQTSDQGFHNWQYATTLSKLRQRGVVMTRVTGKQIALFNTPHGIKACDNRCPHEGYPLSEGNLSDACTLTCNWHNWKFDLDTGQNLFGGDQLRIFPVQLREDEIWIDIADPPYQDQYDAIIHNLKDAFDDHSYDRISREIARLKKLGADPLDALRYAIAWSWQKMEFGWTHAYAGMSDWLDLYRENSESDEEQLICLQESVAHTAYDVLREDTYPYPEITHEFSEQNFLNAVETENEIDAIGQIRGALQQGLEFQDLEGTLTRAALTHYNDFGHSLIYVTKAATLIHHLGNGVLEPLLFSLVRSLIYATREDKIPEFRHYDTALNNWNNDGMTVPVASHWHQKGIKTSIDLAVAASGVDSMEIYRQLLLVNAHNLLCFDSNQQNKNRIPVSGNVGWLDFTHGLTFANAVRKQCMKYPELWPQGLLQMACFTGRNAAYTLSAFDKEQVVDESIEEAIQNAVELVFDHGQGEYIVSVHLLKTTLAVCEEVTLLERSEKLLLIAALKRFLSSPVKRRFSRRTAYQSLRFVADQ